MNVLYYIRRFWEIPKIEKELLLKGFAILLLFKIAIELLPLKYYHKLLLMKPDCSANDKQVVIKALRLAKKTIRRLSRSVPIQIECLLRSILIKYLLLHLKVPSSISLVLIRKGNNEMIAHATIRTLFLENYINAYDFKGALTNRETIVG